MVMTRKRDVCRVLLLLLAVPCLLGGMVGVQRLLVNSVGYEDVLRIELPRGVTCAREKLFLDGFDRPHYSYYSVFHGDSEGLRTLISSLRLKHEDIGAYLDEKHVKRIDYLNWWFPTNVDNYEFYVLKEYEPNCGNLLDNFLQVGLTTNELFLVKIGATQILRKQLKKKSVLYVLL